MIQDFSVKGGPHYGRENLPKMRAEMKKMGLDGFLVPHEDEYNNEYLPDCNERLMWASGFTGSAGAAVVMMDEAVLFVDGRYTLQGPAQTDSELYSVERLEDPGVAGWLKANVKKGQTIGYDALLHSPDALAKLKKAVEKAGGKLKAVTTNPIDAAWDDRPAPPMAKLSVQPLEFAGQSHEDKRMEVGKAIADDGADVAVITAPASNAWLHNIRGGDVKCSPLPLSTTILYADGHAELYVAPEKVTDEVRTHLGNAVTIRDEDKLEEGLKDLKGKTVHVDPTSASSWTFDTLEAAGATIKRAMDPVMLPKSAKNKTEIKGSAAAHARDGIAITRFLHWLDTTAQSGNEDEISAATQLESFRRELSELKDLSFETISGYGPNGAFPHYRVNTDSNLKLARGSLYLVDSGGQYLDGTTDITRTVPIGDPTDEMKRHFTLVLKGHIALSVIRFPKGTTGHAMDILARMHLWNAGLDYDHGTGHGVGVYLGVHEGPQRISKAPNSIALEPGMIVSNEPGFYKAGGYGIRIENLQYVTEPAAIEGGEREMLGFQYLTLAPINLDLVDVDLLDKAEKAWLNQYHKDVYAEISPHLDPEVKRWLEKACREV